MSGVVEPRTAREDQKLASPGARRKPQSYGRKIAAVTVLTTLLLAAGYYYWFFARSPEKPSVLFASGPRILDLQLVARDEPRNPTWKMALAEIYTRDGHFLTAVDSLKTALRQGAPEEPARRRLRTCYSQLEQHQLALNEALRLRALQPRSFRTLLMLADVYLALGKTEKAREIVRLIPVDDQGRPTVDLEPVAAREQKYASNPGRNPRGESADYDSLEDDPGVEREALAAASGRVGDWERSLSLAKQAMGHRPQQFSGSLLAGQALVALGRAAEAVPYFKPGAASGEFRYQTALCLRARNHPGDAEAAIRELQAAVRLEPALGRAWWELGQFYSSQRQWAPATEAFVNANQFGVESPRALRLASDTAVKAGNADLQEQLLGSYYQLSGQPEAALRIYQKRLRDHPDQELPYRQVAGALGALGKTQERLAVLRRGLERFPNSAELVVAAAKTCNELSNTGQSLELLHKAAAGPLADSVEVMSLLASATNSIGQVDEAVKIYRTLLPKTRDIVGVRFALAQLLLEKREEKSRLMEAIRLLEECVVVDRSYVPAYRQLGLAYGYAERRQEAVWALRHAVDLSPGEGVTYQPLAEALRRAGNLEEAAWMRDMVRKYQAYEQTLETLKAHLKRRSASVEDYRALANFYMRAEAYPQAEKEYRRLLERKPDDQQARTRLAEIYGILGRDLDRNEMLAALRARR
jgi:tetratricopeptide (TPR) repeat protein